MSDQPIRILIADDHPVFRFGLRALLEAQSDIVVVGEAESGAAAVQMAQSLRPDVVLMDINMPGLNGIEATKQIMASATSPRAAVLIITMFDDDTVFTAVRAGARGYLLKGAQGDETLRAIRAVANGEVIFSPGVAAQMMDFFARGVPGVSYAMPFPELTPANERFWGCWHRVYPTVPSPKNWSSAPRRCAIRSRRFSASSRLPAAARRLLKRGRQAWEMVEIHVTLKQQANESPVFRQVGHLSQPAVRRQTVAGRP